MCFITNLCSSTCTSLADECTVSQFYSQVCIRPCKLDILFPDPPLGHDSRSYSMTLDPTS